MPDADEMPYQDLRAKRSTVKSDMPMCIAMLQNQAKNVTCQKVNFVRPGNGAPPRQICVRATFHRSPTDRTEAPDERTNSASAITPNAKKTSTIQGAATFANFATVS